MHGPSRPKPTICALHAEALAVRLTQLANEVEPDPKRAGAPDPTRATDPRYCRDVVLSERLLSAAQKARAVQDVAVPPFEFLEGAKATRAAVFGLIGWIAGAAGVDVDGDEQFVFDDKTFLALFASLAVDLGIVFLTLMRGGGTKWRWFTKPSRKRPLTTRAARVCPASSAISRAGTYRNRAAPRPARAQTTAGRSGGPDNAWRRDGCRRTARPDWRSRALAPPHSPPW